MALPLVLHQAGIGIKIECVPDNIRGDGRRMLAGLVESSALALRPQTVDDEAGVASGRTFGGRSGVRGAEVRCPGEREEIEVEVARGGRARVTAAVGFGIGVAALIVSTAGFVLLSAA